MNKEKIEAIIKGYCFLRNKGFKKDRFTIDENGINLACEEISALLSAIPEGENKQDNTSEMADEPNFFKWREDNGWFSINDKKFDYQRGFKSRQYETKEGLHKLFLNRNTL